MKRRIIRLSLQTSEIISRPTDAAIASVLICVLACLALGCHAHDGADPRTVRSTTSRGETDGKMRALLNAYLIAEAGAHAGLVSQKELFRARQQLLEAASEQASVLLPYLAGGTRRSELALSILREIEGTEHVRRGREGQVWPDIDAWRRHFARKDEKLAETERSEKAIRSAAAQTLLLFLKALSENDSDAAYRLISPSSIRDGDPVAYKASLDKDSFLRELGNVDHRKFRSARIVACYVRGPAEVVVRVEMTHGASVDIDEVQLELLEDQWYVVNPISVVR